MRIPYWARDLLAGQQEIRDQLTRINRRLRNMALDTTVLARILAGAASLVQQAKDAADRENALKQQVSDLQGQLGQAESDRDAATQALAADQAADADANNQLVQTADALDALLQGPETPVVETPAPSDAPGVISGDQDPVVVSEEPASNDSVSGDGSGSADTTV